MTKKLILIVVLSFITVLFASCGNNELIDNDVTASAQTTVFTDESVETSATEADSSTEESSIPIEETIVTSEQTSDEASAEMSKSDIIEMYKAAAVKSSPNLKSNQDIYLKNISINNGEFEKVMDFVTPIMAKLLANNSKEIDGITGGYKLLTENDVVSAKTYPVGSNTAIELVIKNYVGVARDNLHAAPVGHAINTVGDIGVVTDQLKDLGLPMEISDENTSVHYTNPAVKVVVDQNGYIVNGTWSYTVDIRLNNYKVFGKPVNSTSVVMDNVISVNGGFVN